VIKVIEHDGTAPVAQDYDAFGAADGAVAKNGPGFNGAPSVDGFQYLRNRWYDPNVGRFTQEDPIGFGGGINLYAYAGSNPVSYSDPYGLCEKSKDGSVTECDKFATYVEDLATHTKSDAEFIGRLGTEVAGLPSGRPEGTPGAPPVVFGASGFRRELVDDANPARHYSAYVTTAYQKGGLVGAAAAVIREIPEGWGGRCRGGCSTQDVRLGLIGAQHGANLRPESHLGSSNYGVPAPTRKDLATWIRRDL
jgi:RHS repeat-associated protein